MLRVFLMLVSFVMTRVGSRSTISCSEGAAGGALSLAVAAVEAVPGRYNLHWCADIANITNITRWELIVYVDQREPDKCKPDAAFKPYKFLKHSLINEDNTRKLDCDEVCMNGTLDLIYAGCYHMKGYLFVPNTRSILDDMLYINNPYTNVSFMSRHFAHASQKRGDVSVVWSFKPIPVEPEYVMELRKVNNESETEWIKEVQHHCNHTSAWDVTCLLSSLAPGHYELTYPRSAPWTHGDIFNQKEPRTEFSVSAPPAPPRVHSASGAVYWVAAGCVVACALAALLAWRCAPRAFTQDLKEIWRSRLAASNVPGVEVSDEGRGAAGDCDAGSILLLYARDAPPFMSAMKILREMLQEVTRGQVHDVFSPATLSEYAASPSTWLRHVTDTARVLLVQTPAAASLYSHTVRVDEPEPRIKVIQPLLGSRVMYREPQFGDTLLLGALQLLRETSHRPSVYCRYYVASLSELPVDMVPHVAPFRRYPLPQAARALLRDLAPRGAAPPAPPGLRALQLELGRFTEQVRADPDYLQHLLTFL